DNVKPPLVQICRRGGQNKQRKIQRFWSGKRRAGPALQPVQGLLLELDDQLPFAQRGNRQIIQGLLTKSRLARVAARAATVEMRRRAETKIGVQQLEQRYLALQSISCLERAAIGIQVWQASRQRGHPQQQLRGPGSLLGNHAANVRALESERHVDLRQRLGCGALVAVEMNREFAIGGRRLG